MPMLADGAQGEAKEQDGLFVRAEVHSDDHVQTAKFDASPFFATADKDEIVELAECGWGGDYPADAVATHVEDLPGYEAVAKVFDRKGRQQGFECHVHGPDAMAWLDANRPDVAAAVRASEEVEEPMAGSEPHWDSDETWTGEYAVPTGTTPSP